MSVPKFIALDLGAGSGRVMLGKLEDKIALEEIHRFPNIQVKACGHLHWDILRLFCEIKHGLAKVSDLGHKDVEGIGVDTWGVDFGLVSEDDQLVSNPICYRDARTDGMQELAFSLLPREDIYQYTGIQLMQINTIFQILSMVHSQSALLKSAAHLLFTPDLLSFLLSGQKYSEYTIASTSQLLNARTGSWEKTIFEKLGLPLSVMQKIVQPGTVIGPLLSEIREETGLNSAEVIAIAAHDTASAVAAVPARSGNWAFLSSGTWSLIGVESERPIITEQSLHNNFTNEGGFGQKIRFLKNVSGMWLLESCIASWKRQKESCRYDELIYLADQAEPFKCIIDPDDSSFLNPADMPTAIIEYCKSRGLRAPETRGEFVRTIFESLAMKYRMVIEDINAMRGSSIEVLHIVGGGSRNEMLNQFTANACGIPVTAGPVEATAVGNILVQAISKKRLGSIEEGRELVAHSFPLKHYEPKDREQWQEVYGAIADKRR
jgi:rhamnulokinase